MPLLSETAYPQLKAQLSDLELREIYTPTPDERLLAEQYTNGKPPMVAFLVLLKTFQRLGYPVSLTSVPPVIVSHIAERMQYPVTTADLIGYDLSGTRRRHLRVIRTHLKITASGDATQEEMEHAMREASWSKDDLVDLINIAIEELIRQRFELPAFSAFEPLLLAPGRRRPKAARAPRPPPGRSRS